MSDFIFCKTTLQKKKSEKFLKNFVDSYGLLSGLTKKAKKAKKAKIMDTITFQRANATHEDVIFSWLREPHVQEFWDNTQDHKDDILTFMRGRKEPSQYCGGKYIYWIALASGKPYALMMTIQETLIDEFDDVKKSHLSKTGHTYGLDYMIGNQDYLGKGCGAKTLTEFMEFFRAEYDQKADTFLIDPATDNPRAKRVYEKAGFDHIADFVMGGDSSGSGKLHHLLIKKFAPTVILEPAGIKDYPMVQNMARFYVYDLSKECGHISKDWCLPADGLFESFDFKNYFVENSRKAYLVKVYDDVAGFVLVNQVVTSKDSDWNVGEFFILARYQGHSIGKSVAENLWEMHPGKWEVSVIPENISALTFWEKTICKFTNNDFTKEIKQVDFDQDQPKRIVFRFDSQKVTNSKSSNNEISVVRAESTDVDFMNRLSKQKRLAYEKAQPQFWKWAGDSGEEIQKAWFKGLVNDDGHICLVAKKSCEIVGFIIGKITSAPEVYAPGGQTLMIDDFCVNNRDWHHVGVALLNQIKAQARQKNVAQIVVVCGSHDRNKRSFLQKYGLSSASEWFHGSGL